MPLPKIRGRQQWCCKMHMPSSVLPTTLPRDGNTLPATPPPPNAPCMGIP